MLGYNQPRDSPVYDVAPRPTRSAGARASGGSRLVPAMHMRPDKGWISGRRPKARRCAATAQRQQDGFQTESTEGSPDLSASQGEYGRGRRAELARRLHDACLQAGIELLPGKAREIVDERVRDVAEQMRLTEPAALKYMPSDWPEETATSMTLQVESAKLAEATAVGTVSVAASQVAQFMTGLTLVVQEAAWQSDNEQLNAGIGEPLDRLSALSRSLTGLPGNVDVDRSELVGAARQLGQLADYIGAGGHFLAQDEVDRDAFARRLAADAKAARAAAGGA
jgi:hypothetical protein